MRFLILLIPLLAILPVQADSGDDTLKFFLSKSDLAVLGKIMQEPAGISDEAGVVNHICEFQVADVLKGNAALKGHTIRVNIKRLQDDKKDKHPLIHKDSECILFLKQTAPNTPSWETADVWFGVQHPSPWMARTLKRLAAGK